MELVLPDGADPEIAYGETVEVLKRRIEGLDGVTGVEIESGAGSITVHLSGSTDSDVVVRALTVPGQLSFRPVLAVYVESPSIADADALAPEGDDGVDPLLDPLNAVGSDGLSVVDDVEYRSLLAERGGLIVYEVGGVNVRLAGGDVIEFPTGADIADARAMFSTAGQAGQWVVVPEFTEEGGRKFTEATAHLSRYAVGDPRRQIAIVLDGIIIAAPSIAADVPPGEGLAPDAVVISLGSGVNAQRDAASLAAALRYGALPMAFDHVNVITP